MFHCNISWTAPSRVTGAILTKTEVSGTPALRVTWTIPQSDLAISQYQVQYRRSGTTFWGSQVTISGSPPANPTILTGLDAGTEYTVRVRAVSEIGAGEWSVEQTGIISESENLYTCGRYPITSVAHNYIIFWLFPLQLSCSFIYDSI